MKRQETIGYGAIAVSILLVILGWNGITLEGEIEDIPTPNTPNRSYFADEPLPEKGFGPFLSVTLDLTWDRDDVYAVIVDQDEKNTCESTPPGLQDLGDPATCGPYDTDVITGSTDGATGLTWQVESGTYYVGIGTFEAIPNGVEVNMEYSVHLQAGFALYFVFTLIGIFGLAYSRVE